MRSSTDILADVGKLYREAKGMNDLRLAFGLGLILKGAALPAKQRGKLIGVAALLLGLLDNGAEGS
jgi:hypothetical protein